MTKTLRQGMMSLSRVPGGEGDGTTQVAVGTASATGEVMVMVRMGNLVAALTAESAEILGRDLVEAAAHARAEAEVRPS